MPSDNAENKENLGTTSQVTDYKQATAAVLSKKQMLKELTIMYKVEI